MCRRSGIQGLAVGYARGVRRRKKKKKKTRELEQKQRAGRSSREQVERSRERRSGCSLEQTRLPPRKGRKTRSGPRRGRNSLSLFLSPLLPLSLDPCLPPSLPSSLPAISLAVPPSLPLILTSRWGLTVYIRDAATPQECPASPPRAYLCTTYYTSVQPRTEVYEACVAAAAAAAAASYRADKDGLKLAPCQSTESTDSRNSASLSVSFSPFLSILDVCVRSAVSSHGRTLPVRVCPFLSSCPFLRAYIGARVSAAEPAPVSRE